MLRYQCPNWLKLNSVSIGSIIPHQLSREECRSKQWLFGISHEGEFIKIGDYSEVKCVIVNDGIFLSEVARMDGSSPMVIGVPWPVICYEKKYELLDDDTRQNAAG